MKKLSDAKFSKEVFSFDTTKKDLYVKIGSNKTGTYICYSLTKQQMTVEQANTVIYPIYDIKGLKAF